MNKLIIKHLSLAVLLASTGCATILRGTQQELKVNSNIESANVIYNGKKIGVTPFSGQVPKSKNPVLTIEKDGFHSQTVTLPTKTTDLFYWNLLAGLFIGYAVDYSTGAIYELSPQKYVVNIHPVKVADLSSQQALEVRQFITLNFESLRKEIQIGKGKKLNELLRLLHISDAQRTSALKEIRKLLKENSVTVSFSDSVWSWKLTSQK
ncbi:hypothetical protein AZI85_13250 [Bdellovibrio bacteriovorus]|uniref:PEGA domain-containing protein n=1 Tax=Bdellovibrio bacteriovorus TaxID=959 RepID=A0A150WC12_BDEBC|nr:PEGA domain-containing protein [Bdellovibrio bacteriovorus]KYG60428.1 hypothetical protein AZI85_13250 [Bdellovibrio bacteriovorus]